MNDGYLMAIIIIAIVIAIFGLQSETRQSPGMFLEFIINQIKIGGNITMVQLKDTQQVSGQLKPKDTKGHDTTVQPGSVIVQSSDTSVCSVVSDPDDESKFTLKAGQPGVAQIDFSADADLGEGVVGISGFVGVEVLPGQATGFGVEFGTPEEQPAA